MDLLQSSARARPERRQREAPKGQHLPSQRSAGSGDARSATCRPHSQHMRISDGAAALELASAVTGRHIQRAGSVVEVIHDALGVARQQAAARASAQRCCSCAMPAWATLAGRGLRGRRCAGEACVAGPGRARPGWARPVPASSHRLRTQAPMHSSAACWRAG